MSNIPFVLALGDTPSYYNHDLFPNSMFRRLHERHHDPLDMHTLGMIARLGAHGHNVGVARKLNVEKDGFSVTLDVGLFAPDEIAVKVVNDAHDATKYSIVVEAKHEEREDDHGYVSRHFVRRYELPKGYDPEKVLSTLSSDGVLTVSVPKPPLGDEKTHERIVQIHQTGPSDLFLKSNGHVSKPTAEKKTPDKEVEK